MSRIMLSALVAVLLIGAGTVPAQQYAGPKIAVKGERYDFGKVVQGTQATHTFDINNVGGEALLIERVQPT